MGKFLGGDVLYLDRGWGDDGVRIFQKSPNDLCKTDYCMWMNPHPLIKKELQTNVEVQ